MDNNDVLKSYYDMDVEAGLGTTNCSFVSRDDKYEGQRTYWGNSRDLSKFKTKCKYVQSGSMAICTDTGESIIYDEINKQWS